MTPKKPTKVDVGALQTQLNKLKQLQTAMKNPGTADISQITSLGSLYNDLATTDGKGLQGAVAQQADTRYSDCSTWITSAHNSLVSGVDTMVTLLQSTIDQHSKADHNAASSANQTGTGNSTSTSGTTPRGGK